MANEAVGAVVLAIVLAIPVFQMKLDIWIGCHYYNHYYGYYHYFCCCSYCYDDYSDNDTNIGTIYTNCFKMLRGNKMKIFLACGLYRHQRK